MAFTSSVRNTSAGGGSTSSSPVAHVHSGFVQSGYGFASLPVPGNMMGRAFVIVVPTTLALYSWDVSLPPCPSLET